MKPKRVFHPILFATYPVLSLYANNTVLIPPEEVWKPFLVVELAALLLWGLLRLVLRGTERSAFATSVAVLAFFSFGPILDLIQRSEWGRSWSFGDLTTSWWVGWMLVVVLAAWRWKGIPRLTAGLNAGSVALFLLPAFSIAMAWMGGPKVPVVKDLATNAGKFKGVRPDIFYIILDGYGRSDVLKRDVDLDNREFIDGLKKRGFYIGDDSRSNYCQTELSLTSALNMGFLPDVVPNFSPKAIDRGILDTLIDRNRVSQILRTYGYGYIGVTSGFPGVHPKSADLVIDGPNGSSLFESALLGRTPLRQNVFTVKTAFDRRRETLVAATKTIGQLGQRSSTPRFVFAHILAPHPPFVFGPNGESISPHRAFAIVDGSHFMQNGGKPEEYAKGYAGQAQTIGRMILAAVDEVLKREATPPIIVIQGDHGPKLHLDQDELAKTDVQEVFPILNAYLVPDEVKKELYPGISPVNSFRTIFRSHFGEDLSNLADRSWYSNWMEPFKLEEVTDRVK